MENNDLDLSYYLDVVRRRKMYFLLPLLLIFTVAFAMALMLPPKYLSQGTVLIEAQNIPEELVQSTVTGYVEERLQTLSQVVLSRQNLEQLIEEYNPYPELQEQGTTEEVVARLREDISMEPIHAEVGGKSGRSSAATVAFTVSYEGLQPRVTSQIANALVSLYLEQNLQLREEKASGTLDFFQEQLTALSEEIDHHEDQLAKFKAKHQNSLPELMQHNMQSLERIKSEINARRQELQNLQERKIYLEGQLATVDPYRIDGLSRGEQPLSLQEELRMLRNEYVTLKSVRSASHPDVVRLQKQIKALEEETEGQGGMEVLEQALAEKEQNLADLRRRYSEKHPDVQASAKQVEVLRREMDQMAESEHSSSDQGWQRQGEQADNPSYIQLQTQITTTTLEIESVQETIKDLQKDMVDYQQRIEKTPNVEQRLQGLQRKYHTAQARYKETMTKLSAAREAVELEEDQMAERLRVIEPPAIPESPSKPNRMAIVLLGFVLASGFGVGSASLSEFMDQSVRRADTLSALSNKPVLGVVPFLATSRDKLWKWSKRILLLMGIAAIIGLWLFLLHNYYQPLDEIWLRILEKMDSSL